MACRILLNMLDCFIQTVHNAQREDIVVKFRRIIEFSRRHDAADQGGRAHAAAQLDGMAVERGL